MLTPYQTNKQINIPYLLKIGKGKTAKLGKYLIDKNMPEIALFLGEGIEQLLGEKLYKGLAEQHIKIAYQQVVASIEIEEINRVAFALPPQVSAIVGIGGGKALDFAKYTANLLRLPFISMPTSTSNDGFCSPTSSLLVDGKRTTVKSNIPFGVVIDLDIIKGSPKICFYSGLGDMVSKVTALADWKAAALRGNARYNDFASMMSYNSLDLLFIKRSSDIMAPEFQRSLVTSLLISGIAMEIAGTSRPASGSEHLISHALDKISAHPKMHGLQVGTATYLCALLQDNPQKDGIRDILTTTGFFDFVRQDPFDRVDFIKALEIAPTVKNDYYTVLSEAESFYKAVLLLEKDPILKELIR